MKANTCALALAILLSIVSGFSQDDYLIRTQWGQKAPYNAFCPSIQGQKAPLSSAAVALGQLVHFHQHPRNWAGKVRYFSRQIHEVDFSQEIWRYTEIESEPAALARLLFHLDVGMRTNFFPNVSLTEWVQMLDFVRNNLQYQVEELQSNTGFQELEFEIRSALSANTPVLFQAYDSLSRAYHYGLIDGGRNIAGRLEYHINWGWGGYADGWYDPGKPGYPFSRYRFKPRLALLTPKAPAVTNISASLDEKDQIRLSWDAPLRDNRLLYQIYRQKRGAPSSLRLMSGWNSRIFFLDMEVEPGTYYEYFVFAAFNGSEATNSLAATATGKAFSEVCPSFFRIADQTEDLTLLDWDLRDA
ncbi:MAG: C10 family peptidase [Haliscomenobacter sp.]|nr:C10 family peptidase [Haliscomenobacter sp.]